MNRAAARESMGYEERIAQSRSWVHAQLQSADRVIAAAPQCAWPVRTRECVPINRYLDYTLLKPQADASDFDRLFREARDLNTVSVCVPPNRVRQAVRQLEGCSVRTCTVIGFPLGYAVSEVKAAEAAAAVADGADELDMVVPIGIVRQMRSDPMSIVAVYDDIRAVVRAAAGRVVKVILETALLTDAEKVWAAVTAAAAGAAMVKTSTGFADGGAVEEDVRLLRMVVGEVYGVKASGGIRDRRTAEVMIAAGADRIGASAGRLICSGESPETEAESGKNRY